jgi:hypothetical protein
MKRTLEAVLDANVINSISRAPSRPPCDRLSKAIEGRRLRVCVDRELGIVSEWEQTANRDFVRQLIIHWQTFGGWRLVELTASLPLEVRRALRRLAFDDAGDKRILRTAYNTEDRRVVSNDPDFWDPRDSDRRSVHMLVQPSVLALLPSSHCSTPADTKPSPQVASLQVLRQASVSTLPSSHCLAGCAGLDEAVAAGGRACRRGCRRRCCCCSCRGRTARRAA